MCVSPWKLRIPSACTKIDLAGRNVLVLVTISGGLEYRMLHSYRTIRHQQLFYSLGVFPSSLQDVEGVEGYFNNHDCYSYHLIWRGSVLDLYTQLFAGSEKSFGEHTPSAFVIASPPPFPSPSPNKLTLLRHCYWETKICAYVNCLIYCTDC